MNPAVAFVLYLLALIVLVVCAALPLLRREPFTAVHGACLGLALVTLVWLVQSGQAAF